MRATQLFIILALIALPAAADELICVDSASHPPLAVDDGRIPFVQHRFGITRQGTDETSASVSDVLEVPEGYRAVVEHVSIKATIPSPGTVYSFQLGTPAYGQDDVRQTFVVPHYTGQTANGRSVFIGSQMTRVDLEAGDTLFATALRNNNIIGDIGLEVFIAGYLVAIE